MKSITGYRIVDNHVHVGWFSDGYHAPKEVWDYVVAAGVCEIAVSSTSTCAELYKTVCRELRELIRLGGERVHPILWLSPRMLKVRYALPYMLQSGIQWQGIKFHFECHPEWSRNAMLLKRGLDVARNLKVPVVFHTGNFNSCHAGLFQNIVEANRDLTFILAHGRPVTEAIDVLRCCDNTYIDTAFMPIDDVKRVASSGLTKRLLFGTDAPINEVFYKNKSTISYIKEQILMLRDVLGDDAEVVLSQKPW